MGQLLPPWPAVRAATVGQRTDVEVWGRVYGFADSALPVSITTAGEQILAGPMRCVGQVDANPIDWLSPVPFRSSGGGVEPRSRGMRRQNSVAAIHSMSCTRA
mgnify:CR=1 FL=1